tara:strand:- start:164 stop:712 length:549 start_codon:yes stop_codon:yes gene_type:complete
MSKISIRKVKGLGSSISNLAIFSVKNLSLQKKIYLAIALLLFLLQFFMGEDTLFQNTDSNYISIFSIIGLIIALIRRGKPRNFTDEKSLFNIIYNDYNLSSYVSLSILSVLYAILQGLFMGAGLGFVFYAVGCLFYGSIELFGINILGVFLCLVFIIATRLVFEAISLIFRIAENMSRKGDI